CYFQTIVLLTNVKYFFLKKTYLYIWNFHYKIKKYFHNMSITIMGDRDYEDIHSTKSKALRINLNKSIFGTFSQIGAGQETVRNCFAASRASRTIAKAMSAYGKEFSDAIYGQ